MDTEKIHKKFPSYFEEITNKYGIELPPNNSVSSPPVDVYRACKTQKIDLQSFLNSYEENNFKVLPGEEDNPSSYSMSVYTKIRDVKRFTKINRVYQHPCLIAKGTLNEDMGLWKYSLNKKSSHVDFWQYEDYPVWKYFKEVDVNAESK